MDNTVLSEQLLELIKGKNARLPFQKTIANFPMTQINSRVPSIPYSTWELIEHMRLAQYDIIDFITNADYAERKWPDDYWPDKGKTATENDWNNTLNQFENDMETLKFIVRDPGTDFTAPLAHAPTYNVLREILLVADHNAYHTGQIVCLRRALNIY
jgi:uncharacterized damage-inducible protein DinB